jgi:hypothetical protein
MSPISSWDDVAAVFTGANSTALQVLFVALAVAVFVGFLVKMVIHERHAFRQIAEHRPVEKGPVVEGEPVTY